MQGPCEIDILTADMMQVITSRKAFFLVLFITGVILHVEIFLGRPSFFMAGYKKLMASSDDAQISRTFTRDLYQLPSTGNLSSLNDTSLGLAQQNVGLNPESNFVVFDAKPTIAIGCAIKWPQCSLLQANTALTKFIDKQVLMSQLLPSFCRTASSGYSYYFYFSYDENDKCFNSQKLKDALASLIIARAKTDCPKGMDVHVRYVKCAHSGKPAWAQNDAMMAAYWDNITYFYRINDDTLLKSPGWTKVFIDTLKHMQPSNLGVVGPNHKGGNMRILTYDFTHRTHVDMLGFYYPREFTDWFADAWITEVYNASGKMKKVKTMQIVHTMKTGTRYKVHYKLKNQKPRVNNETQAVIEEWTQFLNTHISSKYAAENGSLRVISFSLTGDSEDSIKGAFRNTILAGKLLPGWQVRFYMENPSRHTNFSPVLERDIAYLQTLGAHIVYIDAKNSSLSPESWKHFVGNDPQVERFIVRNVSQRLSPRQTILVNKWIDSGKPFHCIRDHVKFKNIAIPSDLFGALGKEWKNIMTLPISELLMKDYTEQDEQFSMDKFYLDHVWPVVKDSILCHDSVSGDKWKNSFTIDKPRFGNIYVGRTVDQHEMEVLK